MPISGLRSSDLASSTTRGNPLESSNRKSTNPLPRLLEIVSEGVEIGLRYRDALFKSNVGRSISFLEEAPTALFEQSVDLDARCCLVHVSYTLVDKLAALVVGQRLVGEVGVGVYLLDVVQISSSWSSSLSICPADLLSSGTVWLGISETSEELMDASLDSSAARTSSRVSGVEKSWRMESYESKSSAPASIATRARSSASSSDASNGDHALLLELPRDRPGLSKVAASAGERGAHVRDRPVAVVGERLEHYGNAARPVGLVHRLDHLHAVVRPHRFRA